MKIVKNRQYYRRYNQPIHGSLDLGRLKLGASIETGTYKDTVNDRLYSHVESKVGQSIRKWHRKMASLDYINVKEKPF